LDACARVGIRPDAEAWRAGRQEGLRSFCTADSGWRHGRAGRGYEHVCGPRGEAEFLYGYDIGRELHEVTGRIAALERRIAHLEDALDDDSLDAEERRDLVDQLSRSQRVIRELERRRGAAEAEARSRGFRPSAP
jgi:hypothetical protein